MTPDQVALRYQILRDSRGSIRSIDPATIRGERCVTCTARFRAAEARVRAQVRRAAARLVQERNLSAADAQRQIQRMVETNLPEAMEDEVAQQGLSYGFRTRVVQQRRQRVTPTGVQWTERREKVVCGACFERAARQYGYEEALVRTRTWEGMVDRGHAGGVSVSARADSAHERMAAALDDWMPVRALVETVPPWIEPQRWRVGTESLILRQFLREDLDDPDAELAAIRAASLVAIEWTGPAGLPLPWSVSLIRPALAEAERCIGRRLARPRWLEEEGRMDPEKSMSLAEAAERLRCSVDHVRKVLVPLWKKAGKAVDARSPDARQAAWRVDRDAVEAERARRFGDDKVGKAGNVGKVG